MRTDGVNVLQSAVADRVKHRARAKQRAIKDGRTDGDATIKVRDIDVLLDGNLVQEEVGTSCHTVAHTYPSRLTYVCTSCHTVALAGARLHVLVHAPTGHSGVHDSSTLQQYMTAVHDSST